MRRVRLVLDLDETVLRRSAIGQALVYFPWAAWVPVVGPRVLGEPCRDAVEVCQRLASIGIEQAGITARWGGLGYWNTRRWLDVHGLSHVSLRCSPQPLPSEEARLAWKRGCIEELQREGVEVIGGVGDRESDVMAYLESGLPIVVGVAHEDPRGGSVDSRAQALIACARKYQREGQCVFIVKEGAGGRGEWEEVGGGGGRGEEGSVWLSIERVINAERQ
jgi:hypothetical protein